MIDGSIEIKIGERTFSAAPLNFRTLIEHGEYIQAVGAGTVGLDNLTRMVAVIAASIRRNEPIDDDYLLDWLDRRNTSDIFAKVLSAGGFSRTGEAQAPAGNGQPTTGASASSTS